MTHLQYDIQRFEPAPTLRRESASLMANLVLIALAGGVAVFIGGPPVLVAMIVVPIGFGFLGRWCYRLASGDRPQSERPAR